MVAFQLIYPPLVKVDELHHNVNIYLQIKMNIPLDPLFMLFPNAIIALLGQSILNPLCTLEDKVFPYFWLQKRVKTLVKTYCLYNFILIKLYNPQALIHHNFTV